MNVHGEEKKKVHFTAAKVFCLSGFFLTVNLDSISFHGSTCWIVWQAFRYELDFLKKCVAFACEKVKGFWGKGKKL